METQRSWTKRVAAYGSSLLTGGLVRTPVGYIDLDVQTGKIVHIRTVEKGTAWKDVPTPEI